MASGMRRLSQHVPQKITERRLEKERRELTPGVIVREE